MNVDGIPHDAARRLEQIGQADVVIGVPGCVDKVAVHAAVHAWREALRAFPPAQRTVMIHADPGLIGDPDHEAPAQPDAVTLMYAPMVSADQLEASVTGHSDSVRTVMLIARQLEAKAVCVLGTLSTAVTPDDIARLVGPVLGQGADLVIARHNAGPFEGLLTRGIFAPLTRTLFGLRLHDPVVVNFACSAALSARVAGLPTSGRTRPSIWLAHEAACAGMKVGEAVTPRPDTAPGPVDLSAVFATTVGSLFADMEYRAVCWQRVRASRPVLSSGNLRPAPAPGAAPPVDTAHMVEAFQSAFRNLADVWTSMLPPATILELKKLTRQPAPQFSLPDELWARIVFDMSLGYRLRVISRDHLLRAFVPLYLAWVASWIIQFGQGNGAGDRQERLCLAFERQKPYLLSRWRWPDRFSP